MNISKVLKEVEDNTWWTEEAVGNLGLCAYFMDGFAGIRNHIKLPYHSMSMFLMENGKFREETKEKEKIAIFHYIVKEMKRDKNLIDRLVAKQRKVEKKMMALSKKINPESLKKLNERELWSFFKEFYDSFVVFVEIVAIPEGGDPTIESYLMPLLKNKEKINEDEVNEVMVTFSAPVFYSFMDREHIDFLKLCISYLEDSKEKFKKSLAKHSRKYFWLRNNFSQAYYLDEKYFMQRVLEETKGKNVEDIEKEIEKVRLEKDSLRKKKKEFSRKYKLSDETRLIFGIYERFGTWIDDRKNHMLMFLYSLYNMLVEIARRKGIGYAEIAYHTVPEIKGLLLDDKRVPEEELRARLKCGVYVTTYDEKAIFTGEDAKRIIKAFDSKISKETVKGIVANKAAGKLVGEVCIIIDPHKEHFPEGKILVTTMTRPDFVHLIKKAKAIITDEGGITCHAAVVSREFGIPCIIGTKNGTRMLKTGDKVEIDTEKGVVRKV